MWRGSVLSGGCLAHLPERGRATGGRPTLPVSIRIFFSSPFLLLLTFWQLVPRTYLVVGRRPPLLDGGRGDLALLCDAPCERARGARRHGATRGSRHGRRFGPHADRVARCADARSHELLRPRPRGPKGLAGTQFQPRTLRSFAGKVHATRISLPVVSKETTCSKEPLFFKC